MIAERERAEGPAEKQTGKGGGLKAGKGQTRLKGVAGSHPEAQRPARPSPGLGCPRGSQSLHMQPALYFLLCYS